VLNHLSDVVDVNDLEVILDGVRDIVLNIRARCRGDYALLDTRTMSCQKLLLKASNWEDLTGESRFAFNVSKVIYRSAR
jgi:hypothetical protein